MVPQRCFDVRFEWGCDGAQAVVPDTDIAVVVDLLSFTTTLSVAVDAGITVFPYRWNDESAVGFADEHDAALALPRSAATAGQISLSPRSVRTCVEPPSRLVLPSPNGSTIAHAIGPSAGACVGAAFRNAGAVSAWIARQYVPGTTTAMIAAGERWPSGALRPAVEDLWGAGAVISGLVDAGWTALSPEAQTARAAYETVRPNLRDALLASVSEGTRRGRLRGRRPDRGRVEPQRVRSAAGRPPLHRCGSRRTLDPDVGILSLMQRRDSPHRTQRPNPFQWVWYAFGGRLPERCCEWVLHDITCRTWVLRHLARSLTQLFPLYIVVLLLPGPLWIRLASLLLGVAVGLFYSVCYMEQTCEHRLLKHGHPPGIGQEMRGMFREVRRATRQAERRRR